VPEIDDDVDLGIDAVNGVEMQPGPAQRFG
jgi:hypothetical protein